MTLFFFIIVVLLVGAALIAYLSTILLGLFFIATTNALSKMKRCRLAPWYLNLASVGVTIFTTAMFWKDILREDIDSGATPFIILCIYGVCAIIFIAILDIHENHQKPKRPAEKYTLRRSSPPGTGFHSSYTREDFPIQKNSRLERVRKNITVDYEVFHQYGIIFKWNLIDEDGNLQLNYEVSNTKSLASKIDKDTDLTIKANVYDDRGNLLCIEESWLEYRQIRRGYAADYFYFSGRSIRRAASIKIYAIDPTEEYDDFDD